MADSGSPLAAQRGCPVDDRPDLPGLEQLPQDGQIGFVLVGRKNAICWPTAGDSRARIWLAASSASLRRPGPPRGPSAI